MDVGYYISELLGEHGDVNVPGLGYFAHTRINGYYNEREGKFYPPGYSVQFDSQFLDDEDALAIYIADKKKISVASSKYFTEKFVLALKQQAEAGEAALADLGWFTANLHSQLLFRSNNVSSTDPEFFGLPAIPLTKIGQPPIFQPPIPESPTYSHGDEESIELPVATHHQPAINGQYETSMEQEDYLMELTAKKRRKSTWVFIVLALAFTGLIIFLVNRYDSSAFKFFNGPKQPPAEAPKIIIVKDDNAVKTKKDTDATPLVRSVAGDSLSVKSTPLADPSSRPRFELIDGTFRTMAEASAAILKFKSKGVDAAKLVNDPGTGPLKKVSIGTFQTRGQAEDALKEMLATQKADTLARIIEINPQTTGIKP